MANELPPVTAVNSRLTTELARRTLRLSSVDLVRLVRALREGRAFEVTGEDCVLVIERNSGYWLESDLP